MGAVGVEVCSGSLDDCVNDSCRDTPQEHHRHLDLPRIRNHFLMINVCWRLKQRRLAMAYLLPRQTPSKQAPFGAFCFLCHSVAILFDGSIDRPLTERPSAVELDSVSLFLRRTTSKHLPFWSSSFSSCQPVAGQTLVKTSCPRSTLTFTQSLAANLPSRICFAKGFSIRS